MGAQWLGRLACLSDVARITTLQRNSTNWLRPVTGRFHERSWFIGGCAPGIFAVKVKKRSVRKCAYYDQQSTGGQKCNADGARGGTVMSDLWRLQLLCAPPPCIALLVAALVAELRRACPSRGSVNPRDRPCNDMCRAMQSASQELRKPRGTMSGWPTWKLGSQKRVCRHYPESEFTRKRVH